MQMNQIEKLLSDQYDFIYLQPTYEFRNKDIFENDDYNKLLSQLPKDGTWFLDIH